MLGENERMREISKIREGSQVKIFCDVGDFETNVKFNNESMKIVSNVSF